MKKPLIEVFFHSPSSVPNNPKVSQQYLLITHSGDYALVRTIIDQHGSFRWFQDAKGQNTPSEQYKGWAFLPPFRPNESR